MHFRSIALAAPLAWAIPCAFNTGSAIAHEMQMLENEYDKRPAVEFAARNGLPTVLAKLKSGRTVNVAYLGGSITAQKGWRLQSRAWLQKRYPTATVQEINAAIGGTGCELGVFRLQRDVLGHKPDLLFVEFAVNDAGNEPRIIRRAMEGIVRQTWKVIPDCDICFVYTLTHEHTATLQQGLCTRAQGVMESVADHYGIPSINMGLEVARLEKEGRLVIKSPEAHVSQVAGDDLNQLSNMAKDAQGRILFSNDGVHPYNDTGQVLYMAAIARSFGKLTETGDAGFRNLPTPLDPANWEGARMVPLDTITMPAGAKRLDPERNWICKEHAQRVPSLWKLEPGEVLSFRFRGPRIGFYDMLGPDCGILEASIDGVTSHLKRFDKYSNYHRLGNLSVGDDLSEGEHLVEIRVLPDTFDKRSILLEENKAFLDQHPERFAGSNWYVGATFVVGEIVK